MTEIITIFLVLFSLLTVFCLYKIFDNKGLYYGMVLINTITFILSFKIALVFKMNINLGIVTMITNFTTIYIYINKYGYKEMNNILKISIINDLVIASILAITNYIIPTPIENNSINIAQTIGYNYKILIAYPIVHVLSEYIIIKLYKFLTSIQENKILCIILIYIITSLLYTIILYMIFYIKILSIKDSIFIGISSYIIGLAITFINLPYIMLMTNKKVKK